MARPSGTVTLLFSDVEGSTKAWDTAPDAMATALARHEEIIRSAMDGQGGFVFKTIGDEFCVVFASPIAAVGAAVAAQRALRDEVWPEATPLRVRMALHTGSCEERDGDYFGPAVNRVARLEAIAHGGQVVLSQVTTDLIADQLPPGISVADLGEHRLKDLRRPEHVFQLVAQGLQAEFPPLRSLIVPELTHNLPLQLSTFIGREADVAAVADLIGEHRLVTLTGPGGCGKTRLAIEVGEQLVREGEAVPFVDLAPLHDVDLVRSTFAQALGVREAPPLALFDVVARSLGDSAMTLVVDNCEHVLDEAAAAVEELLGACHGLRVLATSREPLRISGEHVRRIAPLSLPGPGAGRGALLESEAVALFADRARAQDPDFELDDATASSVRSICEHLDGIPLAIELAASRTRSMPVVEVERRLRDRFSLLTDGSRSSQARQRTLEAAIAWSFNLLSPEDNLALCRLSVFAGSFSLDAAVSVAGTDGATRDEVTDLTASFVDRSLVQLERRQHNRLRLLESIKAYAALQLTGRGAHAVEAAKERHAAYFAARWGSVGRDEEVAATAPLWEAYPEERSDLLQALDTCLDHPVLTEADAAFVVSLLRILLVAGDLHLMAEVAEQLAPRTNEIGSAQLRIKLLQQHGTGLYAVGRVGESVEAYRRCLAECRTSGDERDVATTLYCLVDPSAIVQPEELRSRTRREIVEGCTELVEADRDPSVVAHARFTRGLVAHFDEPHTETGDLEAALSYFEEAGPASQAWVVRQSFGALEAYAGNLARARELITACLDELDQYAAKGRHVSAKMSMALIDARDRQLSDAARWSGEALRIVIDTDFPEAFIDYALIAALVLRLDGRLTDAARLQGAVMGSVDAGLAGLWPHGRSLLEEGRSELRATLGPSAVERAEQDGRREGFVAVASATLPLLDELAGHEGA